LDQLSSTENTLVDKLLTFRISLEGEPRVFREFSVPGHMLLCVLAEKVLIPLMGWSRSYHTYYFRTRRHGDGSLFGPSERVTGSRPQDAVDGAMAFLHGHGVFVDDEKVRVGQLLSPLSKEQQKQPGTLEWVYDLGCRTSHTLSLLRVDPLPAAGEPVVRVYDGAMACPPEDYNGFSRKPSIMMMMFLDRVDKGIVLMDGLAHTMDMGHAVSIGLATRFEGFKYDDASDSMNTQHAHARYDPYLFNLPETQARVQEGLGTRCR
jgi:hypothetical protein